MTVGSKHVLKLASCGVFCSLLAPAAAIAQSNVPDRLFAGVSFGAPAVAEGNFTQRVVDLPFRGELFNQRADYRVKSGLAWDGNAGYMFTPRLGAGIGFSHFGSSETATFFVDVPSPDFLNQNASDEATTGKLKHSQRAFHLMGYFAPQTNTGFDIKIFGGPSRIYVRQQLVDDVEIAESNVPSHTVNITDFLISDLDECVCAWGFNIGADVAKYFTPEIGVGGMFRYSRATVRMKNAFASTLQGEIIEQDYTAGGFMIGGGLRLRFW